MGSPGLYTEPEEEDEPELDELALDEVLEDELLEEELLEEELLEDALLADELLEDAPWVPPQALNTMAAHSPNKAALVRSIVLISSPAVVDKCGGTYHAAALVPEYSITVLGDTMAQVRSHEQKKGPKGPLHVASAVSFKRFI
jgi:hypothetical protein